ncbi:hypothetical protein OS493_001995 [Desmophyllum pertusum]|uniref:Uncharacterized protein n=1 Tax=Desmophyllum pertusum TaxID=174260 RepID=A0A9W9Z5D6_9CNID|nr:hypothetical protein OS493_001995 [Desmophyllum pertusum]
MEFLQEYGDFAETGDDEEEIEVQANSRVSEANTENSCLRDDAVRQVYLVTYSQANLDMFPTRRSFAEAVVCSFSGTTANVLQWVCCREPHIHGGSHYHLAIKLDRCQRWLQSKQYLQSQHDISVHFSNLHHNYFSAWKYVTKSDEHVVESEGHPDLWNSKPPKTNKACSRKTTITQRAKRKTTRARVRHPWILNMMTKRALVQRKKLTRIKGKEGGRDYLLLNFLKLLWKEEFKHGQNYWLSQTNRKWKERLI